MFYEIIGRVKFIWLIYLFCWCWIEGYVEWFSLLHGAHNLVEQVGSAVRGLTKKSKEDILEVMYNISDNPNDKFYVHVFSDEWKQWKSS